ncbi:MAG: hypothetical protein PWP30_2373, partial [Eubacteriaceae bacterium]|nr:hypothetical protein [Eubacteriaceae bacterium]
MSALPKKEKLIFIPDISLVTQKSRGMHFEKYMPRDFFT